MKVKAELIERNWRGKPMVAIHWIDSDFESAMPDKATALKCMAATEMLTLIKSFVLKLRGQPKGTADFSEELKWAAEISSKMEM